MECPSVGPRIGGLLGTGLDEKRENVEEQLISEVLKEEALSIDKIIAKTKLETTKVASTLAILEINGKGLGVGEKGFSFNILKNSVLKAEAKKKKVKTKVFIAGKTGYLVNLAKCCSPLKIV